MDETATAYQSWDERWKSGEGRVEWLNPDPLVLQWAQARRQKGAETALDLGCGVGRHSLALARLGYVTTAIDASLAGLEFSRRAAEEEGLAIIFESGNMTELPFPDASFDYVLSLNVIYHGDASVVRQALAEIRRVLKPGGIFQGTMLSKRNARYGEGREIAPNTFIQDDSEVDKNHPHFYCNARELIDLFEGFEVLALEDHEQKGAGSWHWYVVAEPV